MMMEPEVWKVPELAVKLEPGEQWFYLRPTGFMAGLVFDVDRDEDGWLAEIEAEVTEPDGIGLYGQIRRPKYQDRMGRELCGFALLFTPPLPNVNAAAAYLLRVKTDRPISLRVSQLYHLARG